MRKRGSADSGSQLQESSLYAPILKAAEARLLLALAAANGAKVVKTDTKQAYISIQEFSRGNVTFFQG